MGAILHIPARLVICPGGARVEVARRQGAVLRVVERPALQPQRPVQPRQKRGDILLLGTLAVIQFQLIERRVHYR